MIFCNLQEGDLYRACGTTYAAHSLELKVKASLKLFYFKFILLILAPAAQ